MGLIDRIVRIIRSQIDSLVGKSEDPEKLLEMTLMEMNEELIQLRQSVASAIASQKRTEREYEQAKSTADEWKRRAMLALQKGDERLAREALSRCMSYQETASAIEIQLKQQALVVNDFKKNTRALEIKIADAKTKKDIYIARARSAVASEKLNHMLEAINGGSAFEKIEDRVIELEARSEAIAYIAGDDLEEKFASLESEGQVPGPDRDTSNPMQQSPTMQGGNKGKAKLSSPSRAMDPIEGELEKLRSQLDKS
ncbi:MAG: PspA/IM30 family protein [Oscillatoria sp. SIO1A7]|nr:PspA/IM30 family protein [Oscillatoria sp. SIO1A7]